MQNLLLYFYTSLPFIAVALLAVLAVIGVGIGMVRPRYLAYLYLGVFFFQNSTSYGSLATMVSPGVYARGSGLLFFPLLLWCMLGAWICARISASFAAAYAVNPAANPVAKSAAGLKPLVHRHWSPPCNLRPWFLGWFLLLCAHVAAALFSSVTLAAALAPSGFSNIVWMAPLVSLLLLSLRTREDAVELSRFILLAGLGRALFGLARWAAFGGDPNNVYANMNEIKIKLTFFDINDSLLCTVAFAIAAVNLFQAVEVKRPLSWRMIDWATLCATAACIVLSYRRSAWIGFVLALVLVMMRFPLRRRIHLAAVGLPLMGAGLLVAALRRLGQTKGAGGGLSGLFYDMASGRFGAESERVLELRLALNDFLAHLFTGIGSWGRYSGYQHISWQGGQDGGLFLHSGVLHIALKAGLPGLVLLGGTIWAFCALARRALRTLPPDLLGLATAGAAGLAFMLPDLLVGTPFPQVRTTQMLALCLALPYVAMAAGGMAQAARPDGAGLRRRHGAAPAPANASANASASALAPLSERP